MWERNYGKKGGRDVWPVWVTQMFLELLSHRVPPGKILACITSVANGIHPDGNVMKSSPCDRLMRDCRSILAVTTKTLAAHQLSLAPTYLQHHSDGTALRQTQLENVVVRIAREGGYKCITLTNCILPEDGCSDTIVTAISQAFREGRVHLKDWRETTKQLYPNRQDLLDQIALPSDLTLAKLADGGVIMTDTCDPARKFRRLFIQHIEAVAIECGVPREHINVHEADYWQHLRTVWVGGGIKQLSEHLDKILYSDLKEISPFLRVNTEVTSLLRAVEKYSGGNADYAKGSGSTFDHYMRTYHPTAYLYPVARANGGHRQDIGTEGVRLIDLLQSRRLL